MVENQVMSQIVQERQAAAISTLYDGRAFRSRLEARWGVFFKTLNLPYEYEREGFHTSAGAYLPDFHIPSIPCWIEIKGEEPNRTEILKAQYLCEITQEPVFVFFGEIPREVDAFGPRQESLSEPRRYSAWAFLWDRNGVLFDTWWNWCECPVCGKLSIQWKCRANRIGCCGLKHKVHAGDSPKLCDAYLAARRARFEHGENGTANIP